MRRVDRVSLVCDECGVQFERLPGYVRKGYEGNQLGRYCSNRCRSLAIDTRTMRSCPGCGEEVLLTPKEKYCAQSCYIRFRMNTSPERYFKRKTFLLSSNKTFTCRSSWEALLADKLDKMNVNWEYEPETFLLKDGHAYTPDFRMGDMYIEVKGRDKDGSGMRKVQMLRDQGIHVIWADQAVLKSVYGLNLKHNHLSVVEFATS